MAIPLGAAERTDPETAPRAAASAASGTQQALQQGLLDVRWRVKELLGSPLGAAAGGARAPHLVLDAAHLRLSGSGGCNRLMGNFALEGQRIQFKRVLTTMMSCPQGMAQERSLIEVLGQVQRWHIEDRVLMLMNWQQQVLVKLQRD
ncbi:META domain-containing protein [Mitsuaria sp. WAJ17]|uniref:META domain-containing protein n=1 Tax=Mitsuaria sp. WAJ17 TaxID=2761452 RepID=UPI001602C0B4|nr:META domain-containing protein [Mitsuaria sp. WAJ17]MBB2486913.1 META domain-containing protein [Mitsuaria sp. WAJ17]